MRYEAPLWSTACLAGVKKGETIELFVTPQGEKGQGWTRPLELSDTNMKVSRRLSQMGAGSQDKVPPFYVSRVEWLVWGNWEMFVGAVLHWKFLSGALPLAPLSSNCSMVGALLRGYVDHQNILPANADFSMLLTDIVPSPGWIRVTLFGVQTDEEHT